MAKLSVDMAKFKSSDVKGIQIHNQREGDNHKNSNIDPARTAENYDLHNPEKINFVDAVKDRLAEGYKVDKAIRKDATVMCGIAVQVNKEFFDGLTPEREREFFKTVYETLGEKYGKENIISANVHKDEKAPHLQLNLVPLTKEGRLSAKNIFDRKGLLSLHTDLARSLQERGFDIQRGEPEIEKKQRVSIHEHRQQAAEQAIQQREQELRLRELELEKREKAQAKTAEQLKVQEKEIAAASERIDQAKAASVNEAEVRAIHARTKVDSPIFGKEHVDISIADYNTLTQTAIAGSKAMAEIEPLRKKAAEAEALPAFKRDNARLNIEVTDLRKSLSKAREQINHTASRTYSRYSQKGLAPKEAAAVMLRADGMERATVSKAVAGGGGAGCPSKSDEAKKWGEGIVAAALQMDSKAVALSAKIVDSDEGIDWGVLTAEQAQEKAHELAIKNTM